MPRLGCFRNDAAGGLRNRTVVHRHQGNGVSGDRILWFRQSPAVPEEKLNNFLGAANVHLPLEPQGTTTPETRARAGEDKQIEIFGEGMRGFTQSGPEDTRHINKWLACNCFGDYYTRGGLSTREREMITLCFLAAQGGCEPQLTSHAKANMGVGNEKAFLIAVISQCMPYIGYPRTLNAIRCINDAAEQMQG